MGLCSSPAVANMGIRFAARKHTPKDGRTWITEDDLLDLYHENQTRAADDIEHTLSKQFYVDDFLYSVLTPEKALYTIKEEITRFNRYNLKLIKVQSNSAIIRDAYPSKRPLPNVVDLSTHDATSESENDKSSSLRLQWNVQKDELSIKMEFKDRPKTKR